MPPPPPPPPCGLFSTSRYREPSDETWRVPSPDPLAETKGPKHRAQSAGEYVEKPLKPSTNTTGLAGSLRLAALRLFGWKSQTDEQQQNHKSSSQKPSNPALTLDSNPSTHPRPSTPAHRPTTPSRRPSDPGRNANMLLLRSPLPRPPNSNTSPFASKESLATVQAVQSKTPAVPPLPKPPAPYPPVSTDGQSNQVYLSQLSQSSLPSTSILAVPSASALSMGSTTASQIPRKSSPGSPLAPIRGGHIEPPPLPSNPVLPTMTMTTNVSALPGKASSSKHAIGLSPMPTSRQYRPSEQSPTPAALRTTATSSQHPPPRDGRSYRTASQPQPRMMPISPQPPVPAISSSFPLGTSGTLAQVPTSPFGPASAGPYPPHLPSSPYSQTSSQHSQILSNSSKWPAQWSTASPPSAARSAIALTERASVQPPPAPISPSKHEANTKRYDQQTQSSVSTSSYGTMVRAPSGRRVRASSSSSSLSSSSHPSGQRRGAARRQDSKQGVGNRRQEAGGRRQDHNTRNRRREPGVGGQESRLPYLHTAPTLSERERQEQSERRTSSRLRPAVLHNYYNSSLPSPAPSHSTSPAMPYHSQSPPSTRHSHSPTKSRPSGVQSPQNTGSRSSAQHSFSTGSSIYGSSSGNSSSSIIEPLTPPPVDTLPSGHSQVGPNSMSRGTNFLAPIRKKGEEKPPIGMGIPPISPVPGISPRQVSARDDTKRKPHGTTHKPPAVDNPIRSPPKGKFISSKSPTGEEISQHHRSLPVSFKHPVPSPVLPAQYPREAVRREAGSNTVPKDNKVHDSSEKQRSRDKARSVDSHYKGKTVHPSASGHEPGRWKTVPYGQSPIPPIPTLPAQLDRPTSPVVPPPSSSSDHHSQVVSIRRRNARLGAPKGLNITNRRQRSAIPPGWGFQVIQGTLHDDDPLVRSTSDRTPGWYHAYSDMFEAATSPQADGSSRPSTRLERSMTQRSHGRYNPDVRDTLDGLRKEGGALSVGYTPAGTFHRSSYFEDSDGEGGDRPAEDEMGEIPSEDDTVRGTRYTSDPANTTTTATPIRATTAVKSLPRLPSVLDSTLSSPQDTSYVPTPDFRHDFRYDSSLLPVSPSSVGSFQLRTRI